MNENQSIKTMTEWSLIREIEHNLTPSNDELDEYIGKINGKSILDEYSNIRGDMEDVF